MEASLATALIAAAVSLVPLLWSARTSRVLETRSARRALLNAEFNELGHLLYLISLEAQPSMLETVVQQGLCRLQRVSRSHEDWMSIRARTGAASCRCLLRFGANQDRFWTGE